MKLKDRSMKFPSIALSHIELYVRDVMITERFYTECLRFVVTDRGVGDGGLVFLSRNPNEHHQLVLNPRPNFKASESPVDHISFRVSSLTDLRRFYQSVSGGGVGVDTVSHGTTWSIYFRDPEGNRLEVFADTPWYVPQPCKFKVDLSLSDDELYALTEDVVAKMAGVCDANEWRKSHASVVEVE
jgi:catechol-2,3-dioxygenase